MLYERRHHVNKFQITKELCFIGIFVFPSGAQMWCVNIWRFFNRLVVMFPKVIARTPGWFPKFLMIQFTGLKSIDEIKCWIFLSKSKSLKAIFILFVFLFGNRLHFLATRNTIEEGLFIIYWGSKCSIAFPLLLVLLWTFVSRFLGNLLLCFF